jgi:hypothetical protein
VDRGGNVVTGFAGTVTATLVAEGTPAAAAGRGVMAFSLGVAVYSDLLVDLRGACYAFLFTSVPPLIAASSSPFSVVSLVPLGGFSMYGNIP